VLELDRPPAVLTYSWDRLLVDPLPGPRTADDFVGLARPAPGVLEVTSQTQPLLPAGSSLPRLAAELPARLLLLDPSDGAVGMAAQVAAAAAVAGADQVAVVDVGGDVLTDGRDAGLRSPLADQLAVAACLRAGLPARLILAGLGLDGEIDPAVLHQRLTVYGGGLLGRLAAGDVDAVRAVLDWHPSEASGLLAAAVAGCRGRVEVRDAGDLVPLADDTVDVYAVDLSAVARHLPAADIVATTSLDEAAQLVLDRTGVSELKYEADKAARRRSDSTPGVLKADLLAAVDEFAARAAQHGADFMSVRRLAELVGCRTLADFEALTRLLRERRSDRYGPSVYRSAK
jgi:hypothetical protein